jgi:brefeldin A-inhibited guanine nucleotide-exchange protein 3
VKCFIGSEFALHCVGALLLPTMQSWLRRGNGNVSAATGAAVWDTTTISNFKHYTGLCIDLVVEFIIEFAGKSELGQSVEMMLQQQLGILCDCISQPLEPISRLGCSCIRLVVSDICMFLYLYYRLS